MFNLGPKALFTHRSPQSQGLTPKAVANFDDRHTSEDEPYFAVHPEAPVTFQFFGS